MERLEDSLNKSPKSIWELLDKHNVDKRFIPPFYITVNRSLEIMSYPPRILELYKSLVEDYEEGKGNSGVQQLEYV
jgi:hypothetical protein